MHWKYYYPVTSRPCKESCATVRIRMACEAEMILTDFQRYIHLEKKVGLAISLFTTEWVTHLIQRTSLFLPEWRISFISRSMVSVKIYHSRSTQFFGADNEPSFTKIGMNILPQSQKQSATIWYLLTTRNWMPWMTKRGSSLPKHGQNGSEYRVFALTDSVSE